MSLDHSANAIPAITREQHWHQGDDATKPGYIRTEETEYQTYNIESGSYFYLCRSVVGTALSDAKWKIARIELATGSKMYADANLAFDNVATDPTALAYGYS